MLFSTCQVKPTKDGTSVIHDSAPASKKKETVATGIIFHC